MQPAFPTSIIVAAFDGFIEHVCAIASEARHLLLKPHTRVSHQIFVTSVPHLVSINQCTQHAIARCFHDVLTEGSSKEPPGAKR